MDAAREIRTALNDSASVSFLKSKLKALAEEVKAQKAQAFFWAPVFLALGIGLYFSLDFEPPLIFGAMALAAASLLCSFLSAVRSFSFIVLLAALGFSAAQVHTSVVYTPILEREIGPVEVGGIIDAIEDKGEEGARLILKRPVIVDLESGQTPRRLRITVRDDTGLQVGDRVRLLAALNPPSPPVQPGGFDFQRYMYFQGIGGIGFAYKTLSVEKAPASFLSFNAERYRQAIAGKIEAYLPYPEAGVAAALIIGRKTSLDEQAQDAMRRAGLAHMLAISGLHVGLFAGVLFFFSRLLMAAVPGWALHYPIKKYAALFALAGACLYTVLAGATIPTQRALLMTGIALFAIMIDRSPISLRLVAFAAFCVLLFFPESLLSASFHMSFAAVACLVIFYDRLRPFWSAWHRQAGLVKRVGLYLAGVALTTIVAGLATAPFALFHFNQFALYSVPANLLAMPVLAFVIMPSVVAALLLMPFHLSFIPFWVMGKGIEALLAVAETISALPHAVWQVELWPPEALTALVAGALILIFWRGHLRFMGLVFIFICLFAIGVHKQPDILISSNFKLVSYRADNGSIHVVDRRRERFAREKWMQSYGMEGREPEVWPKEGGKEQAVCDAAACRITIKGQTISYLKQESALRAECAAADIVLAPFPVKDCGAPYVIDYMDARYHGAYGIWFDDERVTLKAVEWARGKRPWSALNKDFRKVF